MNDPHRRHVHVTSNPDLRDADAWPEASAPDVVIYAPLDETMRVVDEQMEKWKATLDWLADR